MTVESGSGSHLQLRVSNDNGTGATEPLDVLVTQGGATVYSGTLNISDTTYEHNYSVVEIPVTIDLLTSTTTTIRTTFGGANFSFDSIVLTQRK